MFWTRLLIYHSARNKAFSRVCSSIHFNFVDGNQMPARTVMKYHGAVKNNFFYLALKKFVFPFVVPIRIARSTLESAFAQLFPHSMKDKGRCRFKREFRRLPLLPCRSYRHRGSVRLLARECAGHRLAHFEIEGLISFYTATRQLIGN